MSGVFERENPAQVHLAGSEQVVGGAGHAEPVPRGAVDAAHAGLLAVADHAAVGHGLPVLEHAQPRVGHGVARAGQLGALGAGHRRAATPGARAVGGLRGQRPRALRDVAAGVAVARRRGVGELAGDVAARAW